MLLCYSLIWFGAHDDAAVVDHVKCDSLFLSRVPRLECQRGVGCLYKIVVSDQWLVTTRPGLELSRAESVFLHESDYLVVQMLETSLISCWPCDADKYDQHKCERCG